MPFDFSLRREISLMSRESGLRSRISVITIRHVVPPTFHSLSTQEEIFQTQSTLTTEQKMAPPTRVATTSMPRAPSSSTPRKPTNSFPSPSWTTTSLRRTNTFISGKWGGGERGKRGENRRVRRQTETDTDKEI